MLADKKELGQKIARLLVLRLFTAAHQTLNVGGTLHAALAEHFGARLCDENVVFNTKAEAMKLVPHVLVVSPHVNTFRKRRLQWQIEHPFYLAQQ